MESRANTCSLSVKVFYKLQARPFLQCLVDRWRCLDLDGTNNIQLKLWLKGTATLKSCDSKMPHSTDSYLPLKYRSANLMVKISKTNRQKTDITIFLKTSASLCRDSCHDLCINGIKK